MRSAEVGVAYRRDSAFVKGFGGFSRFRIPIRKSDLLLQEETSCVTSRELLPDRRIVLEPALEGVGDMAVAFIVEIAAGNKHVRG
jgi:hypothetical protein